YSGATSVYDDRDLVPYLLETTKQAGFNAYQASFWKDFNDLVRTYGMKTFKPIQFREDAWTVNLIPPYLAEHPDERLVDKNGQLQGKWMCTTKLLGDNWQMCAQ